MINLEFSVKEALQLQRTLNHYIREDSLEFPSQRVKNLREIIWKLDAVISEDYNTKVNELNKIYNEKAEELDQEELIKFMDELTKEKLGEHDEIINP
tara:strand:+ start:227 stop:517 length:291 start_codon:yes stop_codon:yes gene_type:complete